MGKLDIRLLDAASQRFGDAVLDPSVWTDILEQVCQAAATTGASLLQSDVRTPDVPMTDGAKEIITTYFQNNLHLNDIRAVRGAPLLLAGAPLVSDSDLFSTEQDMLRDPLYAHVNRYGFRWWAAVGFRSGSALWGLALQRRTVESAFDSHEKKALAGLSKRLTETSTLSKAVGRQVISGMTNALQLIRQAAVAMDRFGRILDVNESAASLFNSEIHVRNRRLFVSDAEARSAIHRLVDQIRVTPDTFPLKLKPIVVRLRKGYPVVIRALAVDGAARNPFLGARVILILSAIGRTAEIDPHILIQAFRLTPAEARLAALVITGLSLEKAAVHLGITRETARNQLKAVFAKTGIHRQTELAALLLKL